MNIIKYPLTTEKAVRLMEYENKLTLIVDKKATKPQIKQAVEKEFKVKIKKINVLNDFKGRKKAIISLSADTPAIDIATELGLM